MKCFLCKREVKKTIKLKLVEEGGDEMGEIEWQVIRVCCRTCNAPCLNVEQTIIPALSDEDKCEKWEWDKDTSDPRFTWRYLAGGGGRC